MTKAELIKALEPFPDDADVIAPYDYEYYDVKEAEYKTFDFIEGSTRDHGFLIQPGYKDLNSFDCLVARNPNLIVLKKQAILIS